MQNSKLSAPIHFGAGFVGPDAGDAGRIIGQNDLCQILNTDNTDTRMIMLSNSEDVFIQTNSSNDCDVNATIALHSQWIYEYFGDCVVEMRQYFAFSVGILSIVCWIFALFP